MNGMIILLKKTAKPGKMHPLQLSLDVQEQMDDEDWLIFDGGNTHFLV